VSDSQPAAPAGPQAEGHEQAAPRAPGALPEGAVPVRVRRAARYRAFTLTGALVGTALGVAVALAFGTADAGFSMSTLVGYLAAIGLLVGGVLGAGVGLLAERRRS
jgi:hypothetical protein